jgi:hypothetical protein
LQLDPSEPAAPRRQPIFGQFSVSQPPNILTAEPAESAADLKESGLSTKLKVLEKKIVFHYLTSLNFGQPPAAASRRVKTRQPPPPRIFAAQPYPASRRLKLNGSGVYLQLY